MLDVDALPGFRRSIDINAGDGTVSLSLEDDYHSIGLRLDHDGETVTALDADMRVVPWSTCGEAIEVLRSTFVGAGLEAVAARGMKRANCTHLHDLTILGAAHAGDEQPTRFEILVSDPIGADVAAEIRRDGRALMRFEHSDKVLTLPEDAAGLSLFKLREWIEALPPVEREAAKLLQWGTILALGRAYSSERHADVSAWPPNCFTYQPEQRGRAVYTGRLSDPAKKGRPLTDFIAGSPE